MPEHLPHGFSSEFFMPHGHCYLWQPGLLWLQVSTNGLIGVSYLAITSTLVFLLYRVGDIPFKAMFLAFGVFIASCGITHFFDVWVIWKPDYWIDGGVRVVTAAASVGTALALPPLVPKALALAQGAKAAHDRGIALETAVSDLASLYEKTRELEQLKTQFFANVSHELRTPLTLILGPVDKLRQDATLSAEQRRDLDVVFRNAEMLLKQVNDLLDVARLEAGKMDASYEAADAAALVKITAAHFEGIAEERAIDYEITAPASLPAEIDTTKIERVILNLLSNAFKFTPRGGKIAVKLQRKVSPELGRAIVLTVADSGLGIEPGQREIVFERFRQLDGSATRNFGGTGLGLAIAQDFVKLHHGRIHVRESDWGGALFTVELPEHAPPGTKLHDAAPERERVSQHMALLALNDLKTQPPSSELVGDEANPLVLVVEDNADMNRFLRESLAAGFRTVPAFDGQDGLNKALELKPDLILTDMMMPRLSGEGLVHELRTRPDFDGTPVVFLTAKADEATRVELLRSGAQDYLMKPCPAEELVARVGNLVTMKRTRDVLQGALDAHLMDVERLARDVSSRKSELESALDAVRLMRDHAERASAVKSNFLRLVSHELRTPLTVLRLHLERMKLDETLSPAQQKSAVRMADSVARLSDLVESVLEHTRIESGKLNPEVQDFDVREVVRDLIEEYEQQARQKKLELKWQAPEDAPLLASDRRLVRLILSNLLDNAIKFTPAGTIGVSLAVQGEEFRIDVSDTGPGIAPDQQRQVFEPFAQLEPLKNKHTPGVGLGLSLVQEMAAALGGRIELASKVSKGSTFTVCLPLRPELARAS